MKKYKFNDGGMSDDMSPEDYQDMKMRERARKAYDQAMPEADTTTAKLQGASAPKIPGVSDLAAKLKKLRPMPKRGGSSMPDVDQMGNATGYKKGGMTASKRGDGIASRGKTRGTMVMCGGGYAKGKK
jgi:hypothetical protein